MFTFAYYDGLSINAKPYPSTCENKNPRNDGSIKINVRYGTPIYNYTLTVDTVAGMKRGIVAAKGIFVKDEHVIKILPPEHTRLQLHKEAETTSMVQAIQPTQRIHMTHVHAHQVKCHGL